MSMILLEQGKVNVFFMRLASTLTGAYFLFKLTNDFTREEKIFNGANYSDLSGQQEFHIEESATQNLTGGVVTLQPSGSWQYEIYEQTSASNLDPDNAIFIDRGKVKVIGTSGTDHTFINSSNRSYVYVNQ